MLTFVAKAAVSALLVTIVASRADISGVRQSLAAASWPELAAALAFFMATPPLGGLRWWLAFRGMGKDARLHLARALNVPATSVWGPTEPVSRLRARGEDDEVFYSRIVCSPCVHVHDTPPCNGARVCIPAALAAPPKPLAPLSTEASVGWVIGPNDRDYRLVEVSND
jgi:hypothetical protein